MRLLRNRAFARRSLFLLLLLGMAFASALAWSPGPPALPAARVPQSQGSKTPLPPAKAQEPPDTAGQPTCASCHAPFANPQPHSGMGRALLLPNANLTLSQHPDLTFTRGAYTYSVHTRGQASTYSVTDGTRTLSVPILWSFGANNQTWMLALNGKMYESLVSYYPVVNGLAITTGDDRLQPATLEQALGRELSAIDVKTCFGCHATNTLAAQARPVGALAVVAAMTSPAAMATASIAGMPELKTLQPGVTCEHCHLGAAAHLLDASNGHFDSTPPSLGELSTENMSNFCGKCHRTWDMVVRSRWRGAMNVRFQPYRLANSACYNGADARISCIACHNPHEDVVRDTAFYDKKCLACHAPGASGSAASGAATSVRGGVGSGPLLSDVHHPGSAAVATARLVPARLVPARFLPARMATNQQPAPVDASRSHPKSCPVAQSNCTSCHMPKVVLPSSSGHLTFTDHEIRVVKAGDAYPN